MYRMWLISVAVSLMLMVSCLPGLDVVRQGQEVLITNMAELRTLVAESEVVDKAKAEEFFEEAEKVLAQGEEILVAIDGEEGIEMVKSGVKATAGWNPYAGGILVGLNILQGLGLFKQKRTIEEIVVGVEKGGKKSPELKNSLMASTSIPTRKIINKIVAKVA